MTEPNKDYVWGQPFRRLIWLMPGAFALHIAEEYAGGFPVWVTHVVGGSFNNLAFALNNAAFMAILLALTVWTSRSVSRTPAFLLIAKAALNGGVLSVKAFSSSVGMGLGLLGFVIWYGLFHFAV